ncbi:Ankyrin repeat domain-containing protein 33B [Tupaia chinensis]|uniref:Ankyrin repeat domain-containing protein 33B n=1 Tax=Tupaia chinensis TaxID=246437 RepID=L9L689_TUPCH|nr:Ankyrin repeat domain-containing protein 33B [Tupaia chinensis]
MSPQPPSPPRDAQAEEDPAEDEEYEDFSQLEDTRSIASDDSFYPLDDDEECSFVSEESVPEGVPEAASLLRAACANDVGLLRALVQRGPSVEEVQETDRNGRVNRCPRRASVPSAYLPPPSPSPGHPDFGVGLVLRRLSRRQERLFLAVERRGVREPWVAAHPGWGTRGGRLLLPAHWRGPEFRVVPRPLFFCRPQRSPVPEFDLGARAGILIDASVRSLHLESL